MKLALAALSAAALASTVHAEQDDFVPTHLKAPLLEQFTDSWEERWSPSHATKKSPVGSGETFSYVGVWSVEEPSVFPGLKGDKGLVMKSKAAHHAISAPVPGGLKVAEGKPLVVQYETKLQKGLECGGAYMKLLSEDPQMAGEEFSDKTPFTIMFGPDKCGATNKVHFIFRHKNPLTGDYEEKHLEATPSPKITKTTALYTLIINPDDTFEIKINDESVKTGSLQTSFAPAVNPPATISDPSSTKPSDWVDAAEIADPDAVKPEDWDESAPSLIVDESAVKPEGWLEDEEENVADPDAEMPEEWDEEEDGDWLAPSVPNPKCDDAPGCGTWTAPLIPNPAYRGIWSAPLIANPAYQGVWAPDQIPNPAFFEDKEVAKGLDTIQSVGLELWTMTDDLLFDNIYLGHSIEDAAELAKETFHLKLALEKLAEKAFLEDEEEEAEAARQASEESFVQKVKTVAVEKYQELVHTWPEFIELATNDWRAALEQYPGFLATIAALFLGFLGTVSALLALLSGGGAPVAPVKVKTDKRVIEGAQLEPAVVQTGVDVDEGKAKVSGVEIGGDGAELKMRKK